MRHHPVWTEGLFLRPQHFQYQDAAHTDTLDIRMRSISGYPWGIVRLSLNDALAEDARVGVSAFSGVMPDGAVISIPDGAPPPTPLEIPDDANNETVYLTLPPDQPGATLYAYPAEEAASFSRFLIREREAVSNSDPERRAETIEIGEVNLRLAYKKEDYEGRVRLAIGRISSVSNGRIIWDPLFIPPSLCVNSSRVLANAIADIHSRLCARQEELSVRAVENAAGGSDTFAAFLLLQFINRWQPVFQHWARCDRLHPESLYTTLLSMAGELATFTSKDRRPEAFPAYDHDAQDACFPPVIRAVQAGLSTEFSSAAERLPLEELQPGAYRSTITDRRLYERGRFYLAVSSLRSADEIRRTFPSVTKIGSITKMQQLISAALTGVPLTPLNTAPPQIRTLPDYVYFELDRSSAMWNDFATAPGLGIHIAGDWPELKLELWCVKNA